MKSPKPSSSNYLHSSAERSNFRHFLTISGVAATHDWWFMKPFLQFWHFAETSWGLNFSSAPSCLLSALRFPPMVLRCPWAPALHFDHASLGRGQEPARLMLCQGISQPTASHFNHSQLLIEDAECVLSCIQVQLCLVLNLQSGSAWYFFFQIWWKQDERQMKYQVYHATSSTWPDIIQVTTWPWKGYEVGTSQ